jgi:hypothetical protein
MSNRRLFFATVVGVYLALFGVAATTIRQAPAWCEAASTHIAAQIYAAAQE